METRTNQYPPETATTAPLQNQLGNAYDPRAAQLLALFQMSDERGKITLLAIAGIHAARFPKEKE